MPYLSELTIAEENSFSCLLFEKMFTLVYSLLPNLKFQQNAYILIVKVNKAVVVGILFMPRNISEY